MPAKNSVKVYLENGYYHVYNRGVEERNIFLDDTDFRMFLYYLKYYLEEPEESDFKQKKKSLQDEVNLLAFCLMPNHFHLLLKQLTTKGMTKLIRAVCTNYVCYFNKRYQRIGGLFQGKYRAVLIDQEPYLLHLSRYIHLNPRKLNKLLNNYPYSSYLYYLGLKTAKRGWLKQEEILNFFRSAQKQKSQLRDFSSYESFVEDYLEDPKEIIENLALE